MKRSNYLKLNRRSGIISGRLFALGFTLLEMLLVVFLVGLASALVGPSIFKLIQGNDLREVQDQLEYRLSRLHNQAILQNRSQIATLDLEQKQWHDDLGDWQLPDNWKFDVEGLLNPAIQMEFFPDGSARPVSFELSDEAGRHTRVTVKALTGQIKVELVDAPNNER
ncbi:prepilin-type N-terminal cleavage/methylation domain-containing protein [Parachitinimonas caeni]|uniref:Prepilin-type N-terminal cleavage/methylation domain-containing protein n=1 Tax=Parachitinimonas caeni TaxID=3031301 RepID=A0ABT7DUV7_9NEIS|nr:prepilin-type N-terminal cleavage/methylation domain-containing protein [Parachitinimonas caeni]MDK2122873.1 prepilin-type N-terminal cleavage/methylation domain-containing protein [Parachitinimonas caeni]